MSSSVCASDLALDTYVAEELGRAQARDLEQHLEQCARCKARLTELEHANRFYYQSAEATALEARLRARAKGKGRALAPTLGLALAALALLAVLPLTERRPDEGTRTKGASRLGFFVKHGDQVREGKDGETVAPGDSVRFAYSTNRSVHLTILSFDASGHASVYFSSWAESGQNRALSSAIELDDTLGREDIHALFCLRQQDAEKLRLSLEQARGVLPSIQDCAVDRIRILKERTP